MKARSLATWPAIIVLTATVSISSTAYYFGVGPFSREGTRLVVTTTTSLYDTGLLDVIEDQFEAQYPIDIYFISAGTGIAITYAQRGDADMILVHAPSSELAFLEGGYGVCRKIIAYSFFAIVGPEGDPAGIRGLSPAEALARIVQAGRRGEVLWVSRGDDSGTHTKEKGLWAAAGYSWSELREEQTWYRESGTGMGRTLLIANEYSAEWPTYTLADMGTYLKYYSDGLIDLAAIIDEGKELLNVYSAIAVNPEHNPEASFDAAITFIKFLVSEECQQIVDEYGQDTYPQQLFCAAVPLLEENANPAIVGWIEEFAFFNGQECPEAYQDGHRDMYG